MLGDFFQIAGTYLLEVLVATGLQLLILLGPLLLLAFIMHLVSGINERLSYRVFGRSLYLYLFGWLGTSVHESGHALFALLFGHKIVEMRLFSPDPKSGTLGYVKHTWNRKNPFQVTGNFFIGIGPILLGSMMLFLITLLLYHETPSYPSYRFSPDVWSETGYLPQLWSMTITSVTGFLATVFSGPYAAWWKTILLIYLVYCIGSSIKLSGSDISSAFLGMLFFLLFLMLFNLATLWTGNFMTDSVFFFTGFLSGFYFLVILSILLNIIFILILSLFYLIRRMLRIDSTGK